MLFDPCEKFYILAPDGAAYYWIAEHLARFLAYDRVEVTGLRPLPLPHHRTCGLPHPTVEPSGFKLPQDPMARINPNSGDGRRSRRSVLPDLRLLPFRRTVRINTHTLRIQTHDRKAKRPQQIGLCIAVCHQSSMKYQLLVLLGLLE